MDATHREAVASREGLVYSDCGERQTAPFRGEIRTVSDPVPNQPPSGPSLGGTPGSGPHHPPAGTLVPVRITPPLFQSAAQRLVSQSAGDLAVAASRLVNSAKDFGIELGFSHGTVDTVAGRPRVRQACLPVLGSGRTAMIFVSEPMTQGDPGGEAVAGAERAACVRAACEFLAREKSDVVKVAQGLPEAREVWSMLALQDAGFLSVGRLSYLRRPIGDRTGGYDRLPTWPDGVEVVPLTTFATHRWDEMLVTALDRSYIDTMDCPELCGMRATTDILASHKATGEFDPTLWWVFLLRGEPHGCLLLTKCPEQRTLELVYLGLSPQLRGQGLSRAALWMGMQAAKPSCLGWNVACAVDLRNAPALKLYGRLGFRSFSERTAMVRVIASSRS